jgi:hypothetical protein
MGSSPDAGRCGPPPDWPRYRVNPNWEAAMTEPRDMHRHRETEATTAGTKLEVKPELIKDLDVPDDEDVIGGTGTRACIGTCLDQSFSRVKA